MQTYKGIVVAIIALSIASQLLLLTYVSTPASATFLPVKFPNPCKCTKCSSGSRCPFGIIEHFFNSLSYLPDKENFKQKGELKQSYGTSGIVDSNKDSGNLKKETKQAKEVPVQSSIQNKKTTPVKEITTTSDSTEINNSNE